jgi:hypothetical protein
VSNKLERKCLWPNLRHYFGVFLKGLRKTTINLSQDNWSLGQDLNLGPPEYKQGVLPTQPKCSLQLDDSAQEPACCYLYANH